MEGRSESIKAIKSLMKTMILGLKTVVWCVSNYKENQGPTARSPRGTSQFLPLTESEIVLIRHFFELALDCFQVYSEEYGGNKEEQRDVLEHFANIFTVLNHTNFHDIFHPHFNNNTRKPSCLTLLYTRVS